MDVNTLTPKLTESYKLITQVNIKLFPTNKATKEQVLAIGYHLLELGGKKLPMKPYDNAQLYMESKTLPMPIIPSQPKRCMKKKNAVFLRMSRGEMECFVSGLMT